MTKLSTISLSVLLAGSAVAAERPAVRMLAATPMDNSDAHTARAASNSGFDPFQPTARPEPRRSVFDPADMDKQAGEPGAFKKFGKWVDDRAKAVKKAVVGTPELPEPRVGQTAPTRRFFDTQTPLPRDTSKVNAANPAYRWYGWGTPTPGANQFAPTGDYPLGSAQWYNQTGATPGAFPVPTMNPYRPAPGTEPPAYVPPVVNTTTMASPQPAPMITFTPPSRTPIAESPTFVVPKLAPAMVLPFGPSNQVPVPPSLSVEVKTAPKPVEPAWKPAAATEPVKPAEDLIIPVIRGQEPGIEESPLGRQITETCRGLVKNVKIAESGPGQLTVTFDATTNTLAEIAVKAMSDIIELKPYDVQFKALVIQ